MSANSSRKPPAIFSPADSTPASRCMISDRRRWPACFPAGAPDTAPHAPWMAGCAPWPLCASAAATSKLSPAPARNLFHAGEAPAARDNLFDGVPRAFRRQRLHGIGHHFHRLAAPQQAARRIKDADLRYDAVEHVAIGLQAVQHAREIGRMENIHRLLLHHDLLRAFNLNASCGACFSLPTTRNGDAPQIVVEKQTVDVF